MRTLLLPLLALGFGVRVLAQCGPCVVGDTCTVDPPFPTVCPAIPPPGTVGVPFAIDVTFWIPPSFAEPTTQLNVILQQATLNSLEDVPEGLTYEASSPTLVYYPQQDPFGCVRVCGVPVIAGIDTVIIHATVQGTVGGIGTTQDYDLKLPITILPATADTVPDFTATPDSVCEPLIVSFDPLLNAPGLTSTFNWDFDNGNTYIGPDPPDQTYGAGDHAITLQTTMTGVRLTQVSISDINEDWCGDIDEPDLPLVGCVGQPDLYFTVTDDQLGFRRSSTVNNTQSHTWSNLAIPLGFPPFTLRVYDDDALSDDDLLGAFTFDAATGTLAFSGVGTSGSRTVQTQAVASFTYTDTVTVFPAPSTALTLDGDVLCVADQDLASYEWTFDGAVVNGESGPCIAVVNGAWGVTGISAEGCTSASTYQVVDVGINDVSMEHDVRILPVPNSGRFVVRVRGWKTTEAFTMDVLDAMGRVVHHERLGMIGAQLDHAVDLKGIAAGSYVLRLADGQRTLARAFIIGPN